MNVKKMFIPILLSILLGYLCGSFVCKIYKEKSDLLLDSTKVYLLQTGAYSTIDSMKKNTNLTNYIYYQDNGLYKTIMAITKDKENIQKLKELYNFEILINEYYLDDENINKQITEYDQKLKEITDKEEIEMLLQNMLNIYKENENLKLAQITS